ncbi:hypothetical protein [Bosea rubneri]|uniref:Uncharacterized protein n=1 Tax=Bosea rubneri TaxID=3075434 RepID=A0ABU3SHT2_9HYPH|nr:hypothetical protein [Bosea sp. ZW T0_25]MDU0343962.1 hypothetical protein [Bosea sp. ZW T0_25]
MLSLWKSVAAGAIVAAAISAAASPASACVMTPMGPAIMTPMGLQPCPVPVFVPPPPVFVPPPVFAPPPVFMPPGPQQIPAPYPQPAVYNETTLPAEVGIARHCMERFGFEEAALNCTANAVIDRQLGSTGRIARKCLEQNGATLGAAKCTAFGLMLKEANPETQMAAECVAQYGVSKVAVACAATRLTVAEFDKCKNGIGSQNGCFGPNNTLRRAIEDNLEAARRESSVPGAVIRAGTGVSVDAIRQNGVLGGKNSEARKICNGVAGVFGGRC